MKLAYQLLLTALLLFPFCLSAQEASKAGKKVTITKRSVDADGSESTEIIIKKGKSAENFDAQRYVQENRAPNVQVEVSIEEAGDKSWESYGEHDSGAHKQGHWHLGNDQTEDRAHLGVSEDSDEDADAPGVVVEITRGSAADRAGLRDNDKIMALNGKNIREWRDLSTFMDARMPGEEIDVRYERNGKPSSTKAKLTKKSEVACSENPAKRGFLGVYDLGGEAGSAGVTVQIVKNSAAQKAGLLTGDRLLQLNDTPLSDYEDISDFMAYTKPGEIISVVFLRDGKRQTMNVPLGEEKSWDWSNWNNTEERSVGGAQSFNFSIREKPACLGVFTEDNEDGDREGAKINDFTTPSAAMDAGLINGDVILSINNRRINGNEELWEEIARFQPKEKINVEYLRDEAKKTISISLKACKEKDNRIQMYNIDEEGGGGNREFFVSDWNEADQQNLTESRVIPIRKAGEGSDAPKLSMKPEQTGKKLKLDAFQAKSDSSKGLFALSFKAKPIPTIVSLHDMDGRQLFREELNAFDGNYAQRFDLSAYANGKVFVRVTQGESAFSEQIDVPEI
jgi:S1-C subfamily serine protease